MKDDERQSLYDCCNEWTTAIGKNRLFMGGEKPNLADLVGSTIIVLKMYFVLQAVYGILSAIEGLDTFNDTIKHTNIKGWYYAVRERVQKQEGH